MIKDFMQCGQSLSDSLKASDNVRAARRVTFEDTAGAFN